MEPMVIDDKDKLKMPNSDLMFKMGRWPSTGRFEATVHLRVECSEVLARIMASIDTDNITSHGHAIKELLSYLYRSLYPFFLLMLC
jgi:hypothetical protein